MSRASTSPCRGLEVAGEVLGAGLKLPYLQRLQMLRRLHRHLVVASVLHGTDFTRANMLQACLLDVDL